jgi:TRAP-type uncharacterized transport system fused permease subunit
MYIPWKTDGFGPIRKFLYWVFDLFGYIAAPCIIFFFIFNYDRLIERINYLDPVSPLENVIAISLIILIVGGILRTIGKPLAIFIGVFVLTHSSPLSSRNPVLSRNGS